MPGAPRSFFVNSALKTTAAYETFITSELHEVIAQRFAADTTREAVAGASMGGYGAAMLALRYPNRYRFAGLVIPALSVPDSISAADSAFAPWAIPFVDSAFGYPPNVHRMTHDPFLLIRQAVASPAPYFYIVAAEGDEFPSFLGITREWVRSLQAANVPYEYHELPGHHDERMLDIALPGLLAHAWITLTSLR